MLCAGTSHPENRHISQKPVWPLFLFVPQRPLHEAMHQFSLSILRPCWGRLTTLLTGTFIHFTVLRLSNYPDNEGIYSLIPFFGTVRISSSFQPSHFFIFHASKPFWCSNFTYNPLKIFIDFTLSPLITTRGGNNIPHPRWQRVWASHSTCNCVWCNCGK